jgi:hypothetical protein
MNDFDLFITGKKARVPWKRDEQQVGFPDGHFFKYGHFLYDYLKNPNEISEPEK